jgi:hypothetical protein
MFMKSMMPEMMMECVMVPEMMMVVATAYMEVSAGTACLGWLKRAREG